MQQDRSDLVLIKDYPYLKPWETNIIERVNSYHSIVNEIIQSEGSLYDLAGGHYKFGFNFNSNNDISFTEWLPCAQKVWLVGDFNNWENTDELVKDNFGFFSIILPKGYIQHKDQYRLKIMNGSGEYIYRISAWTEFALQNEVSLLFNGVFWNPQEPYRLKNQRSNLKGSLKIYEVHIGMATSIEKVGTYVEFNRDRIKYIASLGYNAIQFMAVAEHSHYGSFGYHVTNYFAPTSRCGTPDELKELIDHARSENLIVLLDIVHSHFSSNRFDGLSDIDGSGYGYSLIGENGYHKQWDSSLFNYSNWEVRRFLLSNIRYWIEEIGFDGFRFDGVGSMLYHNHGIGDTFSGGLNEYYGSNVNLDAQLYLMLANSVIQECFERLNELNNLNKTIILKGTSIAEDVSGMPGLCRPISEGGFGFDYRLNMAVPDVLIKYLKTKMDEEWDLGHLVHVLTNRRWGEKHIAYSESHDQCIVGDKTIAFWLMDAAMYTSMACTRDFFAFSRSAINQNNLYIVIEKPDEKEVIVERGIALHKMIRLLVAALGGEGYLNFMGNEFGHPEWVDFPREENDWSYHYCRRRWDLSTNPNLRYYNLKLFDKALINCESALQWMDGPLSNEQFVVLAHEEDKILVFERGPALFIFNFHSSNSYEGYQIGCKWKGGMRTIMTSDALHFGGYNRIETSTTVHPSLESKHNREHSIRLYIPSRVAMILVPNEHIKYIKTELVLNKFFNKDENILFLEIISLDKSKFIPFTDNKITIFEQETSFNLADEEKSVIIGISLPIRFFLYSIKKEAFIKVLKRLNSRPNNMNDKNSINEPKNQELDISYITKNLKSIISDINITLPTNKLKKIIEEYNIFENLRDILIPEFNELSESCIWKINPMHLDAIPFEIFYPGTYKLSPEGKFKLSSQYIPKDFKLEYTSKECIEHSNNSETPEEDLNGDLTDYNKSTELKNKTEIKNGNHSELIIDAMKYSLENYSESTECEPCNSFLKKQNMNIYIGNKSNTASVKKNTISHLESNNEINYSFFEYGAHTSTTATPNEYGINNRKLSLKLSRSELQINHNIPESQGKSTENDNTYESTDISDDLCLERVRLLDDYESLYCNESILLTDQDKNKKKNRSNFNNSSHKIYKTSSVINMNKNGTNFIKNLKKSKSNCNLGTQKFNSLTSDTHILTGSRNCSNIINCENSSHLGIMDIMKNSERNNNYRPFLTEDNIKTKSQRFICSSIKNKFEVCFADNDFLPCNDKGSTTTCLESHGELKNINVENYSKSDLFLSEKNYNIKIMQYRKIKSRKNLKLGFSKETSEIYKLCNNRSESISNTEISQNFYSQPLYKAEGTHTPNIFQDNRIHDTSNIYSIKYDNSILTNLSENKNSFREIKKDIAINNQDSEYLNIEQVDIDSSHLNNEEKVNTITSNILENKIDIISQTESNCTISKVAKYLDIPLVIVSSEIVPYSRCGGLSVVVSNYKKFFPKTGQKRVMLISPCYSEQKGFENIGQISVWLAGANQTVNILHKSEITSHGCIADIMLVRHSSYIKNGSFYVDENGKDYHDNLFRFALLCKVSLEAPLQVNLNGSIYGDKVMFLINDWQTSLIPVYIKYHYKAYGIYTDSRCISVIHNLAYQGIFSEKQFSPQSYLGLPSNAADDLRFNSNINLLKASIILSDRVLTVSPSYMKEIQLSEHSYGLHEIIYYKGLDLRLGGILNGINELWNPATDKCIACQYDSNTFLKGKKKCKRALQEKMGLYIDTESTFLIVFVGRLIDMKGLNIIREINQWLLHDQPYRSSVQIVFMGKGDKDHESFLQELELTHRGRVTSYIGFSEDLEHEMISAADLLLMPSMFEPCGLPQMYAQKYGTLPLVHHTGGLIDSVITMPEENATGFSFSPYTPCNLKRVLYSAMDIFFSNVSKWTKMQKLAMSQDFYWPSIMDTYYEHINFTFDR